MKTVTLDRMNMKAISSRESFIRESEAHFDAQLNSVISQLLEDSRRDIILLAGPSSSGKTTTAGKLAEKIRENGRNAFTVSLDDFYLNRCDIPVDENGVRDFENVTALDIELIHGVFENLIKLRRAELPIFDFKTGERSSQTRSIELLKNDVIVVEGLHSLNPVITKGLNPDNLFKIYISVSSRLVDGEGDVLLSKRNLRLIRRMVRDLKHRNTSAESTLLQWSSVLSGEDKYLFPYECYADVKIDSFHPYEPCMFKQALLSGLDTVGEDSPVFSKAMELRAVFDGIENIDSAFLPEDSLLCEFLR